MPLSFAFSPSFSAALSSIMRATKGKKARERGGGFHLSALFLSGEDPSSRPPDAKRKRGAKKARTFARKKREDDATKFCPVPFSESAAKRAPFDFAATNLHFERQVFRYACLVRMTSLPTTFSMYVPLQRKVQRRDPVTNCATMSQDGRWEKIQLYLYFQKFHHKFVLNYGFGLIKRIVKFYNCTVYLHCP